MKKLLDGYRRFHSHVFPQKRRLYASLASGQSPQYLFITCSDSRIDPLEFTGTFAGDMFMERNVGNLVPEPGRGEHEAGAAIEYAVVALHVQYIVICGHSGCGAMQALLDPESTREMPTVSAWLKGAAPTLASVRKKYGDLTGQALLDATIRENVLVQLRHLSHLPCVAPRLAAGTLQLHGWVLEIEHGQVDAYNPEIDRFVALPQAYPHLR